MTSYDLLIIDVARDTGHVIRIFDDVASPGSTVADRIDAGIYIQLRGDTRFSYYEKGLIDRIPIGTDGTVRHVFHRT